MKNIALGDVRISRVVEMEGPFMQPELLLPKATNEALAKHKQWLMPNFLSSDGMFITSIHTYVIRTKHHIILVDTCVGNDKERPTFPGFTHMQLPYLDTLKSVASVAPEEVDYVMCTHLHLDHVGWNTKLEGGKWVPTFPNAKYIFHKLEWEYWKAEYDGNRHFFAEDGATADSVLPIVEAKLATLVDGNYSIDDQVWLEPTPGHTPGHVCVHVDGGSQEAIMSGDIMHHPVQMAEPEWNSNFCSDPVKAIATRRLFLERNCDNGKLILPAHFATPTAGYITRLGEAFRPRF